MANVEKVAGVHSYVLYGVESTFGTYATPTAQFGLLQSFNVNNKNNLIKSRGFVGTTSGGRNLANVVGGKYENSISMEFNPQVWDWLVYVLGGTRTGSGTGATPYSYPEGTSVSSLTISHNKDNATTDREEKYTGCLINTCTIKSSVGEAVSVSLDIVGGVFNKDAVLASPVALSSGDVFTFVGGSIEIPDGAAISNIIDSIEISINNNAEILYKHGARTGVAGVVKARDYSVKFTVKYLDEALLELFTGSATTISAPTRSATIALKFTNGANKYIDFVFTGATFENFDMSASLNEVLTEDIECVCESLTVGEQQTA